MSRQNPKRSELNMALCMRCQTNEIAIVVRNDPLCRDCFDKYVRTKIVKRLESFRVRNLEPGKEKVLLLALSCGQCSVAMLHFMTSHVQRQIDHSGRTGYKLHVLHIDDVPGGEGVPADILSMIKSQYPAHTYSTISMAETPVPDELSRLFISKRDSHSETRSFADAVETLGSTTSKSDIWRILMRRTVADFARRNGCETVLWGDSTTTLAGRTLAETAKGRGFSLPWLGADGDSAHGVPFHYPMRDLLSKEIFDFLGYQDLPFNHLLQHTNEKPAVSTKNTTIDDLLKKYFEATEKEYPSIVANVVRTSGKLQKVTLKDVDAQCELCEMPLFANAPEKSRLCYGCVRTLSRTET